MLVQNPLCNAQCDVIMQQKHNRLLCEVMNVILSDRCALPKMTMPAAIRYQPGDTTISETTFWRLQLKLWKNNEHFILKLSIPIKYALRSLHKQFRHNIPVSFSEKKKKKKMQAFSSSGRGPIGLRCAAQIGVSWRIGVTWSRKQRFKMAATKLGYLLTKL